MTTEPLAAARVEAAGGIAPVAPDRVPEPTLSFVLNPLAGWRLADQRHSLDLEYTPRLLLRRPNLAGLDRPLWLHGIQAHYTEFLSRALVLSSSLDWRYGELDYYGLREFLNPDTPQAARAYSTNVVIYTRLGGQIRLAHAYARRHRRELAIHAETQSPRDERVFPPQSSVGWELAESYLVDRRDDVDFLASVGLAVFKAGERYLDPSNQYYDFGNHYRLASLRAHWRRRLSRRSTLDLGAGVAAALADHGSLSRFPTGEVGIKSALNRERRIRLTGWISLATDAALDRVRSRLWPLVSMAAGIEASHRDRWSLGASLSASTIATARPLEPLQPQSWIAAQIPFVDALGPGLKLELGSRLTVWASHWAASDFRTWDEQAWIYLALSWAAHTHLGPLP